MKQLDLFGAVTAAYLDAPEGTLSNAALYSEVATRLGIDQSELDKQVPIGRAGLRRSPLRRAIRWQQQTLKALGVVKHVNGVRGVWQLAEDTGKGLHAPREGVSLLGFSTRLGLAIWGDCSTALAGLDQPITLVITSPPYPLQQSRRYGGVMEETEYVDFLCRALEPAIRHLAPGGSLCLNVSNDVFQPGLPARSLYLERLILALADRFGLSLMDRLVWHNPSKPPGPVAWASKKRVQLNTAYEPVLWFCNDPTRISADNRRVLEAHTQAQLNLIRSGGEQRSAVYGDGAYRLRPGSFGKETAGRIPRNVLRMGHACADTRQYRIDATRLGLPVHGAMQPIALPDFLIRFLTEVGDLVLDPFGGTATTGMAAERLGRRWIVIERIIEYLRGAAERFHGCDGFAFGVGMQRIAA